MQFISESDLTAGRKKKFVHGETKEMWVDLEVVRRLSYPLFKVMKNSDTIHLNPDALLVVQALVFSSYQYLRRRDSLVKHVCRGPKHCKNTDNAKVVFSQAVSIIADYNIINAREALNNFIDNAASPDDLIKVVCIGSCSPCKRCDRETLFHIAKHLGNREFIMNNKSYFMDQIADDWSVNQSPDVNM
jgi:hypothetical protein